MTALGLAVPWLISDIVAVYCVAPTQNRAKVYVRTLDKTFAAMEQHLTLGGRLKSDAYVRGTVKMLRTLWAVFFPGIGENEPLPVQHPKMGDWPGFLLYYELMPRHALPFLKIYIPVRQFCPNDAFIAEGVSKYLMDRDISVGANYVEKIRRLL